MGVRKTREFNRDLICKDKKAEKRFWDKVKKGKPDECWEWTAAKNGSHGGMILGGKVRKAHRISYLIALGNIPKGMLVCHKCDNYMCVNPNHLFLGTQKDNMQDCAVKNRIFLARGELNGKTKLKLKDIVEIREKYRKNPNTNLSALGRKYFVTPFTIWDINP